MKEESRTTLGMISARLQGWIEGAERDPKGMPSHLIYLKDVLLDLKDAETMASERAYEQGIDAGRREGEVAFAELRRRLEDRRQHWKRIQSQHDEDSPAYHEALVHELEVQDCIGALDLINGIRAESTPEG